MPVFKQYTESSYKWGIWKASESLEELLALLPHKEKYEEGIGKFTAVSRKLEWLAVRVLLYTMLGEEKEIHYFSVPVGILCLWIGIEYGDFGGVDCYIGYDCR